MDRPLELEEPQQQREEMEDDNDNESIDFVQIDQSEKEDKEDDDQENIDEEEDHDQQHHNLVEGGAEQQQERNLTDWTFDGLMDSSAGGQSVAAAAELVNLRMAALTVKFKFFFTFYDLFLSESLKWDKSFCSKILLCQLYAFFFVFLYII
jgi:hypothetical protein